MKKTLIIIITALIISLLSGCFFMPVDRPPPTQLTYTIPTGQVYPTVPVSRGDIKNEVIITAEYISSRREHHFFPADDIPVLGIYVTVGQEVSEGDLIAALDVLELEKEYEELNRRRELSELELSQLERRQAIIARQAASAGIRLDNSAFIWSRDTLRLTIAHQSELIEYIEQQKVEREVRALIDGVIINVATFHEGMVSSTTRSVATISVDLVPSFVITDDVASTMNIGDRFEMYLSNGLILDVFLMEVIDPEDYGIEVTVEPPYAYITFVGPVPGPDFETTGRIIMTHGEVHNVLYIPVSALRRTDERNFVYVIDDNGLRTIRDVVPGLEGGGFIEIKSGLEEGELVTQ